ncbi:membrane protein [Puia dinghuensis]|uniref:Membrane protein n=1 Tax=Puia dinghuensis TaxID=1792502 RepID=A0A8J2XT64_9BACT|nr:membrane protein [Puia dinghuensis]
MVAGIRYVFVPADKEIFGQMVTGKAGDTVRIAAPVVAGVGSAGVAGRTDSAKGPGAGVAGPVGAAGVAGSAAAAGAAQGYVVQKADGLIETCKNAVTLALGLIGIMAVFMGLVTIAEAAGGMRWLARVTGPFFSKLFPDVPKGHPAMGHMVMNFSANLLGLDNAATPFALKAMDSLQEINPHPETASNSQIMFLCLHASGLQVIPVSMIALRASMHAPDPTDIFVPIVIATFITTVASMCIVAAWQRINVFQPAILLWVGGISVIITALVLYLRSLTADHVQVFSRALSGGIILLIFFLIVGAAVYKKIDIFGAFVQGAKGGFDTAVRIIPYLVGMLAAISLLRVSGTFDTVMGGIRHLASAFGADTRWVDGMPTALIKPLTSAGARGMLVDTMHTFGPDSFAARLSGIMQGSSETVFYVVAVYFGSVAVRNTRYAIPAMLLAEVVSVLSSIFLCYLFFGK